MRVLLITDHDFGWREQALLRRLLFGLMDEGVRTALASPRLEDAGEALQRAGEKTDNPEPEESPSTELIERLSYTPARTSVGAQREARRLRDRLERALGGSLDAPAREADRLVVHALGEGCWGVAMRLACSVAAGAVFEVWRDALVDHVRRCEKQFERQAGAHRTDDRCASLVWSAADERLADRLRPAASAPVALAPWGAHPAASLPTPEAQSVGCAALVTSGEDSPAVQGAIEGFAIAARDLPDALLFVDEAATRRDRSAWRRSAELGVLDHLAMLPDAEAHRELTLRCPALLLPDRLGERRSIALDAMARGVAVLAAAESPCAWFIDGETALLAPEARPQAWAERLALAWSQSAQAQQLRAGAIAHIRQRRLASAHVAAAMQAYERALAARTPAD